MSEQKETENQNTEPDSNSKDDEQKPHKLPVGKFNGLFNVWTVVGTIVLAFAALFFSLTHFILAFVATGIGVTFYLIALHYELKEKYENRSRAVSPILGVLCWIILIILAWPSPTEAPPQKEQAHKPQDSVRVDSMLRKPQQDNVASRQKSQPSKQPNRKKTQQVELKTVPEEPPPNTLALPYSFRETPSPYPEFPFGIQVVIHSTLSYGPINIQLKADQPIGEKSFGFSNGDVMMNVSVGVSENIFTFRCKTPALVPEDPLIIKLFSSKRITKVELFYH